MTDACDPGFTALKRQMRERQRLFATNLVLALLLALVSTQSSSSLLPKMATALLAATLYLLYEGLDPVKASFLHHQRIRLLGTSLALGSAALVATLSTSAAVAPLSSAALIALRYHRATINLNLATGLELSALKHKLLSLESQQKRAQELAPSPESAGDKSSKDG